MIRLILFRLSETYFRHRWLYLIPTLVMLIFAAAYVVFSKPQYTAQGVLYVQQSSFLAQLTDVPETSGSYWSTPAQITSGELSSLLETDAFIRAIVKETDLENEMDQGPQRVGDLLEEVRESVWVRTMGDNQVYFGASYDEPQVAVQLVNGMINSYLRWRTNGDRADSEVALNFFTDLIGEYRGSLETARAAMRDYLSAHPEPLRGERSAVEQMEIERLQSEINMAEARYINAIEKEEDARLSLAQIESDSQQTYIVIDAPHLPYKNAVSRREQALMVIVFAAAGVMLSLGAVIGAALLDRTYRVPLDVRQRLGLPVLAIIPDTARKASKRQRAKQAQTSTQPAEQSLATGGEPKNPTAIPAAAAAALNIAAPEASLQNGGAQPRTQRSKQRAR